MSEVSGKPEDRSRRYWGSIAALSRSVVLLLLFFPASVSSAATQVGAEQYPDLAELYVASAVTAVRQFPGPSFVPGYIAKRDDGHVVNVVPAMEDVDFDPNVIAVIKDVGADLQKHSSGISINVVDESTIVQFVQYAKSVPDHNLPDAIIVVVGDIESIDRAIRKAAIRSPEVLSVYQSERSKGEAVCLSLVAPRSSAAETPVERQTIGMVSLYIESGGDIRPCLYRSLLASFGLGGQIGSEVASMFSDHLKYTSPTPLDWSFWRIHTDPRMHAGMTGDEALIAAKEIISSWN